MLTAKGLSQSRLKYVMSRKLQFNLHFSGDHSYFRHEFQKGLNVSKMQVATSLQTNLI